MPERRYNDDEVAAIFARASEVERTDPGTPRQLPSPQGLTLTDLQQIGREAGIAPELVARAAQSLDRAPQPTAPTFLGLPLGVARTVKIDHRMTDAEWERLVADLRETFDARGVVRTDGSLRHWANGNLHVFVEPDGSGQRIRFRTMKGDARALMLGGLAMMGVSAAAVVGTAIVGAGMTEMLAKVGTLVAVGAGAFVLGALRVPGWAKLRRRQMEEVAERLTLPRTDG